MGSLIWTNKIIRESYDSLINFTISASISFLSITKEWLILEWNKSFILWGKVALYFDEISSKASLSAYFVLFSFNEFNTVGENFVHSADE